MKQMDTVPTIAGFLLYKKPTRFTVQSPVSPGIHILPLQFGLGGLSNNEMQAIGTRCGTLTYHHGRLDDYLAYKKGTKSMQEIIFQNDFMLTLEEYKKNWRHYHNQQMRRWFGEDLMDVY